MMNAWVLHDVGDISYEKEERPRPGTGEVLVKVEAAGICASDIPRIYETGAHNMPLIPGHEFSGSVIALGDNVSEEWLGKPVGVYPLIPCHKCPQCKGGAFELCRDYDYLGSRRDGGFAEYVSVPAHNIVELPDSIDFEKAALLEPMAVAAHAVRRSASGPEPVAVCGLGAIGIFTVLLLLDAGYGDISVIVNKDGQIETLKSIGILSDHIYDIREPYFLKRINSFEHPVAMYFDCAGTADSISYGLNIVSPGGRIVLVGNPGRNISFEKDIWWKILRNQLTLTGTWNSSFSRSADNETVPDDWHYVLSGLEKGTIDPTIAITHRFKLKDLDKGLYIMKNKSEYYSRILLSAT